MRKSASSLASISKQTRAVRALTLLVSLPGIVSLSSQNGAHAADLVVRYDQSQLLRLPRPASEIIIGNPSIADVAMQGGNLLVVTGKTFGITNIIALDADRNVIQDQRVMVERDDASVVNLHKGSTRFTYSCTPNCEPNLTIGDDKSFFDTVAKHNAEKTKFSEGSADGGGAAAQ